MNYVAVALDFVSAEIWLELTSSDGTNDALQPIDNVETAIDVVLYKNQSLYSLSLSGARSLALLHSIQ